MEQNYTATPEGDTSNIFKETYKNYSHIEIHNMNIFSTISCATIFSHHNFGPRNIFCFAHKKRAVQRALPDFYFSTVKKRYHLIGGQRPLLRTLLSDVTGITKFESGHHLVAAVFVYDGTSQEDCISMKKSMTETRYLQSYEDVYECTLEKKSKDLRQKFGKIDKAN